MTQFNALASTLRSNFLLCCGAAILLTACGGNIDAGADQLPATAAASIAAPAAPAPAAEAIADPAPSASPEAAPAVSTEAAPTASTAGATDQAADVTTQAFELSGYDSNPPQAQPGQQHAANAPAPIQQ